MLSDPRVTTATEALERNRAKHPDKPFIIAHEGALSYEDVARLSAGFAAFLGGAGVGRGDRVCLLLPRVPELIVAFLGAVRIGAVPVPVNYTVGADEVGRFLAAVAPAATVVHGRLLRQHRLAIDGRAVGAAVAVGEDVPGCTPWREACAPAGGAAPDASEPGGTAYLNYTTGTTGSPRGAVATHGNVWWNTWSAAEAFALGADDVHLCMFASFAHPHELFARALFLGGSAVLLEEINPKTIARTIRERGVTAMMGLAPMYDMLATHCSGFDLGPLRIAESGGMYTRPDTIASFRRAFGIPVLSVWGSTETTGIALANTPSRFRTDGSAGRACPGYAVRVVDEDGRDVEDGTVGEMIVSGPGVVGGYREAVPFPTLDGGYRTGDLVSRDAEGFHYFVERRSGLLKVAGLKVYPLQIEIALQGHPGVREAAVVGIEDRLRGVVPKAFVIPREGCRLDPEEVLRLCRSRLADYMVPREIEIVDEFPRIGSGKVDKRALTRPQPAGGCLRLTGPGN